MIKLAKEAYLQAYSVYERNELFFPIIAAVLLDEQDGIVYADSVDSPTQVYVEHAFGFAQLYGDSVSEFEYELERYLLIDKAFHSDKVRLYCPSVPGFLEKNRPEAERSYRQRFHLDHKIFEGRKRTIKEEKGDIQLRGMVLEDVALVERAFKVVDRFWRSSGMFVDESSPCLVFYRNKLASICYSAATASGCAEVDVLTLTDFRRRGLAAYAVTGFVETSNRIGISPLWDCYSNNTASMQLANSMGFVPKGEEYQFFTVNRQ